MCKIWATPSPVSVKIWRPPHHIWTETCDLSLRIGFLIIKDYQCGSSAFVHQNCLISVSVSFYCNFIYITKCKLNTQWVNECSLTKIDNKINNLAYPSSSTQSSPSGVFWDKTKGTNRIVNRPFIQYCSKPLKRDDLEGRGGREGGLLTALSILPVDQPCIWEVTCGLRMGLVPLCWEPNTFSWLKKNIGVR